MDGLRGKCGLGVLVLVFGWVALAAIYGLLKPIPNGCVMTYMYPTYIPIPSPANVSWEKYGLFLYHEGWQKIDFAEHLKGLSGVPVLFIPGNGGSYKQVRSLAAESSRAYQGGPLEPTYFQEASFFHDEMEDLDSLLPPSQYTHKLDWFTVDLEGEHSAMDGQILEEHTEYVVYAIHKILDQYQGSREAQSREDASISGSPPSSVILIGHSMGGFVARGATVHPLLRKSAVETILTLSSPHQSPPIALQPSLGYFYSKVNEEWKRGYHTDVNHDGELLPSPKLSRVVVVSIYGGIYDYQVRSNLASLDGIVPSTHGFTVGSSGMKNVWLSMDHQSILWCNQLVVQVSHSLLNMVNMENRQLNLSVGKRLYILTKMLQSGLPQSLKWATQRQPSISSGKSFGNSFERDKESLVKGSFSCPSSAQWNDDVLEKDIYIESTSVTVLAMDGRRRWLDIKKLGSNGRGYFVFVTNLAPCSGIRLHLWPERRKPTEDESLSSKGIIDVTSKMVQIPAGPAPRQIEPGSQTEQAPPSAFLQLSPQDMDGFRFLTISVAPRPTVSGKPPPATSMAVGQFFNPEEGSKVFSSIKLLRSSYAQEELLLKEDHPLALNLLFSISLGLLPVKLALTTAGCGIKPSAEKIDDAELSRLCKLRCFPPVALAWDITSGLHVIPNIYEETLTVDSSPATLDSTPGSDKTIVLLLIDPHCSYKMDVRISLIAAASRFCLLYSSQIVGFMIAAAFFALMQQARAWELDASLPSFLSAVELNLKMPWPFILLVLLPIGICLVIKFLFSLQFPPAATYISVSLVCYIIANGCLVTLILSSKLIFYAAATFHVFLRKRWISWEDNFRISIFHQIFGFSSTFYSLKIVQLLRGNPLFFMAFIAIPLVCFVHPALGLTVLLMFHAFHSHTALSSFLAASLRTHSQRKEFSDHQSKSSIKNGFDPLLPMDDSSTSSPSSAKTFSDHQLELFNYRHGVLILHLLAALMFVPSLVAWLQRIGIGQTFPWFLDSALCIGVILHGLCASTADISIPLPFPSIWGHAIDLSLVYLLSGYYTFVNAMASAPYKAFYPMAAIGIIYFSLKLIDKRSRERGEHNSRNNRRHSHKH